MVSMKIGDAGIFIAGLAPVRNIPSEMVVAEEREAKTCLCCLWRHTEVMARQAAGIAQKNLEM